MALQVTDNLKQQLNSPELVPVLVAKIDGYPNIFGNVSIKTFIRIGDPDLLIDGSWEIGGFRLLDDQEPYISYSNGTTTRISQKLDPSRGQGSSISSMTLAILDHNGVMTELVSPGKVLADILGRRVTVFLGAQESSWPEDYNVVFRGIIQEVDAGPGVVNLVLSNTDEKKRVSVAPKVTSELTQSFNFRSVTFQDLQFVNRDDIVNQVDVTYIAGGTAGSESVSITGGGYSIQVQIENGASTASQIKKAIENHSGANQLVNVKTTGNTSNPQVIGSAILGTDTTVNLVDASEFIEPGDILRTYAKIEDELFEYTGKTGSQLTGCIRAANGTDGALHSIEKTAEQVFRISGNGIVIALKLMLSQGPSYYAESLSVFAINTFSPSIIVPNAIFFKGVNLIVDHGVSPGDKVTVEGSSIPWNNVVDDVIQEVGLVTDGSYIIISSTLTDEPSPTGITAKFVSQFNTLPIGMGMIPAEVDVDQHLYVRDTFLPTFELDLFINDISDGKGFLEKQVYLPMTCFSVPRKGRSSIVYTVGPLPTYEVMFFNTQTVQNPEQLRVKRSLNENFFNQVQFDFDYDPVKTAFVTRKNYPAEPSQDQINVGIKPFSIESQGLRSENGAATIASSAADRLRRRYEKAAYFIKGVKPMFSIGYQLEIGDVVAVDFTDLKLSDFDSGTREGSIKLMEIQNKILDNKTGEVTVDLVNTTFGFGDRFGLISPSSDTIDGCTTTKLLLKKTWSTRSFEKESKKWSGYIGQEVIVHNEDWSTVYSTVLRGFDSNDPQGMSVDPLPTAPGPGWIIQSPDYPSSLDQNELAFWKLRHAFFSPRVQVVAGVSSNQFTVSPSDALKFFVGSIVRVHSYDFSADSTEVKVTDIIGNDIIVSDSLGFVPDNTHYVDLIGFPDKQQSYRVV